MKILKALFSRDHPSRNCVAILFKLLAFCVNTWSKVGQTAYHHYGAAIASFSNGNVYLLGGVHSSSHQYVEKYIPEFEVWISAQYPMKYGREDFFAAFPINAKLLENNFPLNCSGKLNKI